MTENSGVVGGNMFYKLDANQNGPEFYINIAKPLLNAYAGVYYIKNKV